MPKSRGNKLAVRCGGTEGETEMDMCIPAKRKRWVEAAYCLPQPFHCLPIQQITSLQALFRKAYVPDYI